jgi:hypothetical protein
MVRKMKPLGRNPRKTLKSNHSELSSIELQKFSEFLSEIPMLKGISSSLPEDLHKISKFLSIKQYPRGSYIYKKKDFIDSVFLCLKGKVLLVEEQSLDLEATFTKGVKKPYELIGHFLRWKLYKNITDIFVKTQLERMKGSGVRVENNIKFLSEMKKRQIKVDDQ